MAAIEASLRETERALAVLELQLKATRFVAGDAFTMGDIPVGALTHRSFALGIARAAFPNVTRWHDSLAERSGYRTHVMQPLS